MSLTLSKRRAARPIRELSDRQLRAKIREAHMVIERTPDKPPHHEIEKLRGVMEAAAREREAASAELARREQERKQTEQESLRAKLRRIERNSARNVQAKAFDAVSRFAHWELQGERLAADRLTDEEGAELLTLATRRSEGTEPLSDEELHRYEQLVGTAAGDDGLFEKKRSERAASEKRVALEAAERRLPQAESLVAAVMADEFLLDGLRHRIRTNVLVEDEYGRKVPGGSACRIFEYENVAALQVLLSLIVANGGNPIIAKEHGVLPDGLPQLPQGAVTQLRRNGYLTIEQEGAGLLVGPGPRIREIAAYWLIQLPEARDGGEH